MSWVWSLTKELGLVLISPLLTLVEGALVLDRTLDGTGVGFTTAAVVVVVAMMVDGRFRFVANDRDMTGWSKIVLVMGFRLSCVFGGIALSFFA
jgi:hypothetical protein